MSTTALKRLLKQTVVWFDRSSLDVYGKPIYAAGAELLVRYEQTHQEFISAEGQKLVTKATMDTVSTAVAVGDLVWYGSLNDLSAGQKADPASIDGAWRVEMVERTPDLRGRDEWRTAYLV